MENQVRLLRPIKDEPADYDRIEREIRDLLTREIFRPAMKMLGPNGASLKNSGDSGIKALFEALSSGRVTLDRGTFSGRFNASRFKRAETFGRPVGSEDRDVQDPPNLFAYGSEKRDFSYGVSL